MSPLHIVRRRYLDLEECRVAQASRFYMMMYVLYVNLYISSHDTYAGIDGLLVFRIVMLEYLGAIPEQHLIDLYFIHKIKHKDESNKRTVHAGAGREEGVWFCKVD
jgi:hypothetical protein